MADEMLAAAVLDRLRANPYLTVHDGYVPDGAARPYVLVYMTGLDLVGEHLPMTSDTRTVRVYAHCVGDTAMSSRIIAGQVRTSLLDWQATAPGLVVFPARQEASNPPARDESTGELVMDQVDVYAIRAVRSN